MNNKYSIEICHIYADETFSDIHLESFNIFKKILKEKNIEKYSLKILIDNFHADFNHNSFMENLINEISNNNININLIAFEKDFNHLKSKTLELFNKDDLYIESFRKDNKKVLFL